MKLRPLCLLGVFSGLCPVPGPAGDLGPRYAGSQACARCHREIAATQSGSNMALTWQSPAVSAFAAGYTRDMSEGPRPAIEYHVAHNGSAMSFQVRLPERPAVTLPVESVVGGKRHGLSFLARLEELEGRVLWRPALVEARYLQSAHSNELVVSPGFPAEKPLGYETAFGRVLSPSFEKKCLSCHGSPQHSPAGQAGVQCESCHGPGQLHAAAASQGRAEAILNPGKLKPEEQIDFCARCHAGFSTLADPLPEDVLISNQATALRLSECYIQSGRAFACTSCHDPHRDSRQGDPAFVKTCLGCHGESAQQAAPCPVDSKEHCIGCHMPQVHKGAFALVDHWIRVHPAKAGSDSASRRPMVSRVRPRRLFLRIIVTRSRAEAEAVREELSRGASFFELARKHSMDPSAKAGGFLGEMWVDRMDSGLAAAASRLAYGERSDVLESRGRFILLERLPRDFRWQAIALEEEASALKSKGQLDEAMEKVQQALQLNPHFLRGLVHLGVLAGEKGDRERAIAVLEHTVYLFPRDPSAHYNLGIAYGAAGRSKEEMNAYSSALDLEPDLVPAYQNLGAALFSSGQYEQAAEVFERGLQVNPLSATLHYNLGLARQKLGQPEEAARAFRLAGILDTHYRDAASSKN